MNKQFPLRIPNTPHIQFLRSDNFCHQALNAFPNTFFFPFSPLKRRLKFLSPQLPTPIPIPTPIPSTLHILPFPILQ